VTPSLSELAARRLRRDVSAEQDGAEYTERRARLVRAATEGRGRGRGQWLWLLLALAGVSVAGFYVISTDRATTFTAGEAPGVVGAFYAAPARGELPLRFGDGSELRLRPGSNARVLRSEVGQRSVVLEAGSLQAELGARAGWTWVLSAGPFLLESARAELELAWDVASQAVDVRVRSGSVSVRGPGLGAERKLEAGEQWTTQGDARRP